MPLTLLYFNFFPVGTIMSVGLAQILRYGGLIPLAGTCLS